MGFVFSRPAAPAALPAPLPSLTIRNLTITTLELTSAQRVDHPHLHLHPHKQDGPAKAASHTTSRRGSLGPDAPPRPPTAGATQPEEEEEEDKEEGNIPGVTIKPFSASRTTVDIPDPAHHEQLRLTFRDPDTGHRYTAEIPGPSRRSIVLQAHAKASEPETKEFTAIYLPQHAFLALFSSANLSSWMSTLPPSLPLSALSIPGTHNSPTCYVALPSVRCQVTPIPRQLTNGVRFLDVRVSVPPFNPKGGSCPDLALVHSAFPISLTGPKHLSALLATLYAFLAENPSETLLLSLKREGTGRGTDADLSQILQHHYIAPNLSQWYTSPAIPTLAASRGRIVLVRRFKLAPSISSDQGGIDGSVWPDNVPDGTCGSGTIRIQDYYGVMTGAEIARKVKFAQEGLERAGRGRHVVRGTSSGEERSSEGGVVVAAEGEGEGQQMPLFINFLSASNFFNASCWPDRIAVKINPSMIEYLCMGHGSSDGEGESGDAATGIVVTDWVGHHGDWDLIRCIVGWNARLQLRE